MFKNTPLVVAAVIAGVLGAVAYKTVNPTPDPLCTLIGTIEPEAKCELLAPKEGKVTMADKTEMYCKLAPKAGLQCKPITEQPKQQPAQPQPAAGQGSGAAAPSPDAGVKGK